MYCKCIAWDGDYRVFQFISCRGDDGSKLYIRALQVPQAYDIIKSRLATVRLSSPFVLCTCMLEWIIYQRQLTNVGQSFTCVQASHYHQANHRRPTNAAAAAAALPDVGCPLWMIDGRRRRVAVLLCFSTSRHLRVCKIWWNDTTAAFETLSVRPACCRVKRSDVKRGQNLEAETEAEVRALRPRPRPRLELWGQGRCRGRGQFLDVEAKAEAIDEVMNKKYQMMIDNK